MKRIHWSILSLGLGLVVLGDSSLRAQGVESGVGQAAKKVGAAVEGLNKALSSGGGEGISSAGETVFNAAGGFGKAFDDASVVRSEPEQKPKGTARDKLAAACWEVCVKFGPLNICYAWETRCK